MVFIDSFIFGRWVTTADPAVPRILAQSERFRILYDAAKQESPLVEVRQMLRLDRVVRPWKESGALNSKINLYGFWSEQAFLTKSGDLGIVLRVHGVDYESLDHAAQEYAVERREAALKTFVVGFHLSRMPHHPRGDLQELKTQFSNDRLRALLREQIEGDLLKLEPHVHSFVRQLSDFVQIEILPQNECFRLLRRLLNYDACRIQGHPKSTQFLDYQVANSDIEAERDHLRVGDPYVPVLAIKEAVGETKPLLLKQLLEIQANFCVVTEWVPIDNAVARKEVTKRKRHFNVSNSSFISSVHTYVATVPRDVLIDESKQADIENRGDCIRVLGDGQRLGDYSLTIILYADDKKASARGLPDAVRIFTSADCSLFSETYYADISTFRSCLRCIPARRGTVILTGSIWRCSKPTTRQPTT